MFGICFAIVLSSFIVAYTLLLTCLLFCCCFADYVVVIDVAFCFLLFIWSGMMSN